MTLIASNKTDLSRRAFVLGATGLSFAVTLGGGKATLIAEAAAKTGARDIGLWVRITPDDVVTILTPGAEMGQGSMTGVPIALAEEMDADWDKVVLEMAPADPDNYGYDRRRGKQITKSMAIVGSRAVRSYYDQMRIAGAQVRKVLIDAAAKKWGVPAGELKTEPNAVVHPASGRKLSYGAIAAFAEAPKEMPKIAKGDLKKASDFRLIGKSVPRRDIPAKVNGSAEYSIDVQLPGLVYASTKHSPVQLAKPASWNDKEVRAMKGVLDIVKLPRGVAVVADTMEHALKAKTALKVNWSDAVKAKGYDSDKALAETYPALAGDKNAKVKDVKKKGDVKAAFDGASKVFKAEYKADYGYHAQMEPLNGVARFNAAGDKVEIWEGSQAPGRSREKIAQALGMKTEQVTHHQCYLGGGFGRRSRSDFSIEAALIAREIKKPVKMIWTREEDLAYGMFRPQNFQTVEAALDESGKLAGWRHCVVGDGNRLIYGGIKLEEYYKIGNSHIEQRGVKHGIRLKHWRAVAHPFNLFAIEGLVDEMAAAEKMDPFEFRRKRINMTPKAHRVFDLVEKMSDWKKKRPKDRALGLSVTERSGSLGAGVVEISLDRKTGKIHVHKVWTAIDGGTIVQPTAAIRNIESGIVWGISSVLKERASIKNGTVEQSNFHDYELLRMSEAPEEIHVEFVKSSAKPTGLGEIGNPVIGAAVANAFYALTGKRLYHMPFTPERVLAALKA